MPDFSSFPLNALAQLL